MKIIATKAQRHKGILFFLTWYSGVLVAIFIVVPHDAVASPGDG
jgi:hypothetical protein